MRSLTLISVALVVTLAGVSQSGPKDTAMSANRPKPSKQDLKKKLTPLQYEVTQNAATEPPFQNEFWNSHEAGLYVDVITGEPLFGSLDKFDSGCGWPSFSKPLGKGAVTTDDDLSLGMRRTEVRAAGSGSHLGHVFDDGPGPTGLRYCINSASLRFVPVARMAEEGYGDLLPLFGLPAPATETAILAGGCFWGMEEILRAIPGVRSTEVGYTGGTLPSPTYEDVSTGETGHAEAVRITFDPKALTFEALLGYFFRMHDPTTPNRQHNDAGTQYRSAIFYTTDAQRLVAEKVRAEVDRSGKWGKPVVTEIVKAGPFTPAEAFHQDYLQKHPDGYSCHFLRD
jgi:peptide methionine sulfoxide reductase msrA/msrB